jgi:hypothetical protein
MATDPNASAALDRPHGIVAAAWLLAIPGRSR